MLRLVEGASAKVAQRLQSRWRPNPKMSTPPVAIYYKLPFDSNPDLPPRISRYILEVCDYEFPVARPGSETEFREPGIGIFKLGSPLLPLRAILEERTVATETCHFISARGVCK